MDALDWRSLPSLSSLRAFEATVRLGSFAAAARALNVTQPAVAQQVRTLEADLGVPLVRREGRAVTATGAGQLLAAALGDGFATIAGGVRALRQAEERRGLVIATAPAFAQTVLMPRLGDFWMRHPDIPVSIDASARLVDPAPGGPDVMVRTARSPDWPGLTPHPLLRSRFIVAGAAPLVNRSRDLAALPWILTPDDDFEAESLAAMGLSREAIDVTWIDNPMLAVSAARAGYGLIFATDIVLFDQLATGEMVDVSPIRLPELQYWICTPKGRERPAARLFRHWLVGQFAAR